jgi:hypothetical protein
MLGLGGLILGTLSPKLFFSFLSTSKEEKCELGIFFFSALYPDLVRRTEIPKLHT